MAATEDSRKLQAVMRARLISSNATGLAWRWSFTIIAAAACCAAIAVSLHALHLWLVDIPIVDLRLTR